MNGNASVGGKRPATPAPLGLPPGIAGFVRDHWLAVMAAFGPTATAPAVAGEAFVDTEATWWVSR